MKINNLSITDYYNKKLYSTEFKDVTLIWSKENSYGKTTLIRFILYALGFDIPSTKKIKMKNYITSIKLDKREENQIMIIKRINEELFVSINKDKIEKKFNLKEELEKAHSFIFGFENKKTINNLLGSFYIDQDKGWTLLNRGKVISSKIGFNIEEFILGLNNSDTTNLDSKIIKKEEEIKRYEAILNIVKLSEEQQSNYREEEMYTNLKCKKANLLHLIKEIDNQINDLKKILENNNSLIDTIESYKLYIKIPGKEKTFLLTRSNIKDFNLNNFILKSQIRDLKLKKENLKYELMEIIIDLSEYDKIVDVDEISKNIIHKIKSVSLNQTNLSNLVDNLRKEKNSLEKEKNKEITNKEKVKTFLSEKIKEYSKRLNIFNGYIDKEKDYLLTRNLKEHSGSLYHKATLCYRLSYYACIKEKLGISLPFIVDSPGASEMTEAGMKEMIDLIKYVVGDGQIIISSIYDEKKLNLNPDKRITLNNGIFGNIDIWDENFT